MLVLIFLILCLISYQIYKLSMFLIVVDEMELDFPEVKKGKSNGKHRSN